MRITHKHIPIKPEGYTLKECEEFFPLHQQIDFTIVIRFWNNADDTSGQYKDEKYGFVATPMYYKTCDGEHYMPLGIDYNTQEFYNLLQEDFDDVVQLSTSWELFNI